VRGARPAAAALATVLSIAGVTCGGDNEAGSLQAFCEQALALDDLKRHPRDPELDRLVDESPEEIRDESEILVASAREFREGNENAANSPEIQGAGDRFDRFVEENCRDAQSD
jgi:hypothetical protein